MFWIICHLASFISRYDRLTESENILQSYFFGKVLFLLKQLKT